MAALPVLPSRRTRFARQLAAVLCAAALGTLLFSARVAPMLFDALPDDRAAAGRIAGRAFESAYWTVLLVATIALGVSLASRWMRSRADIAMAATLLLAAATQLSWIAPAIARRGAGWPWSFGSLHVTGGAIHLLLALLSLMLAWRLLGEDAEPPTPV